MSEIMIKGVPIDMGAGRRGVDMGVSAIRLAGLSAALESVGHTVVDCGNIEIPIFEHITPHFGDDSAYVSAIAEACRLTREWLHSLETGQFPLILGGDHSISMGTVSGVAKHGRTGIIWIDAHTDINTPEGSPSGNVHGMPIAHLLGYGDSRFLDIWGGGAVIRPEDIVYIGIRSIDDFERSLLRELGIYTLTMKDIDKGGIASIAERTLKRLRHLDRVHVSFDVDVLDPMIAPGVGTPVPGGLSYREAHLLMELLSDARIVTSLDVVEVNPILDVRNQTAQIAVEMTASLLGKTIL